MTVQGTPTAQDAGATLHLGGDAWCTPDLEPLLVAADTVTLYPGNARRHDQEAITASVRELGVWRAAVAQQSTGHVLVGNGQHTALLELGADRVPVTWRACPDDLARAIVIRDNHVSDLSDNDSAALLDLLRLSQDAEVLALTGMTADDIDDLARHAANLDFTQQVGLDASGTPVTDAAPPIDIDGDTERVTVTVDAGHRSELYALLAQQPWVRDVADAHVRKPSS